MKKEISYIELCQMVKEGKQPKTVTIKADGRRHERLYTWHDVCRCYVTNNGVSMSNTGFEYLCQKARFEYEVPVLDEVEHRYLKAVFSPNSIHKNIHHVVKMKDRNIVYILVRMKDMDELIFPCLSDDSMYAGMEPGRMYTLEELGL